MSSLPACCTLIPVLDQQEQHSLSVSLISQRIHPEGNFHELMDIFLLSLDNLWSITVTNTCNWFYQMQTIMVKHVVQPISGSSTLFSTRIVSKPVSSKYFPQQAIMTFSMWKPPKPKKMLSKRFWSNSWSSFANRYTPSSQQSGPHDCMNGIILRCKIW